MWQTHHYLFRWARTERTNACTLVVAIHGLSVWSVVDGVVVVRVRHSMLPLYRGGGTRSRTNFLPNLSIVKSVRIVIAARFGNDE